MRPLTLLSSLLMIGGLWGCSGGSRVDANGVVVSGTSGPQSPLPSGLAIGVLGRDFSEFPVTFSESSTSSFQISNLPAGEALVFSVSGGTGGDPIHPTLSFPMIPTSVPLLELVALPQVTYDDIVSSGVAGPINPDGSIIMGMVTPGSPTRPPYTGVQLLYRSDGTNAANPSTMGPFYFDANGNIGQAPGFQDNDGSYIFFNVPAGLYDLCFQNCGSADPTARITYGVIAVKAALVYGYHLP